MHFNIFVFPTNLRSLSCVDIQNFLDPVLISPHLPPSLMDPSPGGNLMVKVAKTTEYWCTIYLRGYAEASVNGCWPVLPTSILV